MIATMEQTALAPSTHAPGAESLLAVLRDALAACEEVDLDLFHARTAAGSALVSLAALARAATNDLGAEPGTCLTDGPGVVVVRDLAVATRLLGRAAACATADLARRPDMIGLVATAEGLHATLLAALPGAA